MNVNICEETLGTSTRHFYIYWTIDTIMHQSVAMLPVLANSRIHSTIAEGLYADRPFRSPCQTRSILDLCFSGCTFGSVCFLSRCHAQCWPDHISTAWHQDAVCPCRLFESAMSAGGIVKLLRIPNGKAISNARIKTKGGVASKAVGKWQRAISGLSLLCARQDLTYQQWFAWCVRAAALGGSHYVC